MELDPHPARPVMWLALSADRTGTLAEISGLERAAGLPGVRELVVVAEPGQRVRPYLDVADKLGWALLQASTIPALDAAARRATEVLRFEVVPDADPDQDSWTNTAPATIA
jgi:hypothetical protein